MAIDRMDTVTLPLGSLPSAQSASTPPARAPAALPGSGEAGKDEPAQVIPMDPIVVVDDDELCRKLAKHILGRSGYEVVTASSGYELLDLLERSTPRLLLLDLDMPGLSGLEVCRKVKTDPRHADLPIIFLTGTTTPEAKASAFAVGGADYVTKPIERIELLARIKCQLELATSRSLLRQRANALDTLASERMGRLEQVRCAQTSMLTNPATFTDLNVAVRYVTANEAGGDFYEISRLSDERFAFLVTDVAGHDLSVPLVTGAIKALGGLCLNDSLTPGETMIMLNSGLRRVTSAEQYVTGVYAKFDREFMGVEIVSAAHPPALIQRRNGQCEYIPGVGDVLGMLDQVMFESSRIEVASGDRLFLYTDGLTEGYRDEQGRTGRSLFGAQQLRKHLEALPKMPLAQAVNAIVDPLINESGGNVADDIVLLGIEF